MTVSNDVNEEHYRMLVDSVRADVEPYADLQTLYAKYGLPADASMSLKTVTEHLYEEISNQFTRLTAVDSSLINIKDLKHQLLIRHFCDNIAIEPYLSFLDTIMGATRQSGWELPAPCQSSQAWHAALTAAANYQVISPAGVTNQQGMLARHNERQYAVAQAVKTLRSKNFRVTISEGKAHIAQKEMQRIASEIDRLIGDAGGLEMISTVFHHIRANFDAKNERYHVVRRPSQIGGRPTPDLPVGYLLNLAVKNAGKSPHSAPGRAASAAKEAQHLAIAFASTFDLQPYNQFETMFHEGKRLVRFLQEIAIYDGMFTLKQSRPSDVERTVRTLFAWVSDADAARLGFTIGQAAVVARWIMKQVRNVRGPFAFQDSDIKRQVSLVAPSIIDDVLAIYTHTAATNSTFSLPHEQNAVDFWFRPLLHHPAGHYVVADGSWCAPAFYEAILGALRRSGVSELDTKIGTAFEDLVKTELTKHNVTYVCGRYNQSGCEGECDLVVETDDTIILLELKKKSLTRAARSGSDIDIIFDVAESLLAAQTQLGQHERLLYEDGFLTLNSAGLMCSLDRRGRQIERVAVSLLDFGALQDRNLLSQIMLTVTGFNFDSANSVHANKIHAIQLLCEELRQQYEKLAQLRNRRDASLFMNCWFLSLGHLRQILDGVSSNDEFRRSLFVTRHVVMSTLDLYFEHEEMLRIKRKAHPP